MASSQPNALYYFENHTSAQTNNLLVAAPSVDGRRIRITGYVFSSVDAGVIWLVEDPAGTPVNITQKIYVGATGGIAAPTFVPCNIPLTAETALGFTSETVTNHSVGVYYILEP